MTFNPTLPLFVLFALAAATLGAIIYSIFNKKLRKAKTFRRLGIVALIVIAMFRPCLSNGTAERDLSNLNIFFIIDNTGSMAAKDMGNMDTYRYKAVAEDMEKIVGLFGGAKFAIITLDYNVYQAMPLIDDTDTALAYINALSPKESTLSSDSNLSSLLTLANERVSKYKERYAERDNILFFMSDGENDGGAAISVPSELKQNIVGGAVIGYGTTSGVHVGEVTTNYDTKKLEISETAFIKDRTGTEHISKLDETELAKVANALGLPYYRSLSSADKFNSVNNFASSSAIYHRSDDQANVGSDFYWIFVIFAIALLFWDFYAILNTILLERKAAK
jgi:Ca-activated chloride channel family protein